MNVLHAPKNVGSQSSSLARAENAARTITGAPGRSWSVNFSPKPTVAPADEDYPLRARADEGLRGKVAYAVGPLRYGWRRRRDFDVLHLYFGESLFSFSRQFSSFEMLDLPLWRSMGKRLFMTFQGCDARIKGVSAEETVSACRSGFCDVSSCTPDLDRKRRTMIEKVVRHCDKVFCLNPDLVRFVPGSEFLPYCTAPLSSDPLPPVDKKARPVVVHAPTNRSIKGTRFVEEASRDLQSRVPHDLVMIENLSRKEALDLYRRADVAVDQVLVGWYGGFAVEAMRLGVPVMAYINPKFLPEIPTAMAEELPIVNAAPSQLAAKLHELLEDGERRRTLRERGLDFVSRWHDPVEIAKRMLELYHNPEESFWANYEPAEVSV